MNRLKFDGHYIFARVNDQWEAISVEWDQHLKNKLQQLVPGVKVSERSVIAFAREAMLNYIEECLNGIGQDPFTTDERKFVRRCLAKLIT